MILLLYPGAQVKGNATVVVLDSGKKLLGLYALSTKSEQRKAGLTHDCISLYTFYNNTGCPAKHVPLMFFEFLSFLGV